MLLNHEQGWFHVRPQKVFNVITLKLKSLTFKQYFLSSPHGPDSFFGAAWWAKCIQYKENIIHALKSRR